MYVNILSNIFIIIHLIFVSILYEENKIRKSIKKNLPKKFYICSMF